MTAVVFGLWVAISGYWVFALGFLLWGLKSALTSGALEALVYEELQRLDATEKYATLMGRGRWRVYWPRWLGCGRGAGDRRRWFPSGRRGSVAVCLLASLVATLFPEHRIRSPDANPSWLGRHAGRVCARHDGRPRSASGDPRRGRRLGVGRARRVHAAADRERRRSAADVALLMVVIWAGASAGGLLAGRAARLGSHSLAVLICCGAVLMAAGALSGIRRRGRPRGRVRRLPARHRRRRHPAAGQHLGPARATVTSLAGMSTDVATLVVYGSYAALADSAAMAVRSRCWRCRTWRWPLWLAAIRAGLSRRIRGTLSMSVTAFQDLPLADRDREWDGDAAEKRVRKWADAQDEPNQKYRDAHVWYDSENKDNFTAYKLLIADVIDGKLKAVPRGIMAAGGDHAGLPRRRRPAQGRYRPGEEPSGQVLQEDGRHGSLGTGLASARFRA